ncbi:glycosyltransferase family 2 protein [Candidatus Parcubacteria bacterium]|nr:glycosyltransferase family 2 protein [Patescibacteria group bacterium]MCG2694438.1 glycosyltransferase family 2 protein [Candidatus Parcubacteria bacterium]
MKIFIVIPAYNEEKVIGDVIRQVREYYSDIVVVDDGSTDGTDEKARQNGAQVLRHILNRGQGATLRTGINYALAQGADIIVTYDADGQFEAGEIDKLCQPVIDNECDIILGSRFLSGNKIPFIKKLVLKSAILFTRAITGLKLTDTHNGFRVMNRKAAENIKIRQDRMAHASEIVHETARLKLRYKELPITVKYTTYSRHKGQRLTGAFHILFDLIFK